MPQDKLEKAIQEVIKNNHYSKEEEIKFRKFIKELNDQYNKNNSIEAKADVMIKDMENGKDVLGEEKKENQDTINRQMGYTAPWLLGLVSGLLVAAATIGLILIVK